MLGHSSGGRSAALLYRRFVKLSFNPSGVASRVSTRRVFGYEVAGFGVCWCALLIKLGVTLVWGSVSGAWWCGLGLYTYYISIATADVANVLGLPNGLLPMSERDDQLVGPELRAWREEIKQRKGRITVKVLGTQLLELKDGENGSGDPQHAINLHSPLVEAPLVGQPVQGFERLFETTTGELLLVATWVGDMVRQNNTQAYGDRNFRRVAEASKLLLGVTQNAPKGTYSTTAEELHTLGQSTTKHDDAF
nr:uncharacterized protein LOC109160869 [Ipomoea batatas]